MEHVIVTGGAGFIGSHTVEKLLNLGHPVTVIDNCSTGRWANLDHLKNNPKLKMIEADINDAAKIGPAFLEADWVIHQAALADVVPSIEMPMKYFHSNVSGTMTVLELARQNNIKRFVYAASSSCYGIPENYPTKETEPVSPQYPYALTKLQGEECVMHYAKIYKLPAVSLRLFNVYGPRSRTSGTYGAVFGVFLRQKIANQPFTVVGDGKQSRDFTYVGDVADAFITAAKSSVSGEIMNVGSGNHYSINRLCQLLEGEITYIPKRPGEPDVTFAETSKIQKLLNWKPKVTFEEGVKTMLSHIDYWKDAPLWNPSSIEKATKTWFQYLS